MISLKLNDINETDEYIGKVSRVTLNSETSAIINFVKRYQNDTSRRLTINQIFIDNISKPYTASITAKFLEDSASVKMQADSVQDGSQTEVVKLLSSPLNIELPIELTLTISTTEEDAFDACIFVDYTNDGK
jgi:hypothetical protein